MCPTVVCCILPLHESSWRPRKGQRGRESGGLIVVRKSQRAKLNRADERQDGTDIKSLQGLSHTQWDKNKVMMVEESSLLIHCNISVMRLCIFHSACKSSHMFSVILTISGLSILWHKHTSPTPKFRSHSLTPASALSLHLIGWWWGQRVNAIHSVHPSLYFWLTHSYTQIHGHRLCVLQVFFR